MEMCPVLPVLMVRQAHHEGLILSLSKDEARLTCL
jgi:hypothetical protein